MPMLDLVPTVVFDCVRCKKPFKTQVHAVCPECRKEDKDLYTQASKEIHAALIDDTFFPEAPPVVYMVPIL